MRLVEQFTSEFSGVYVARSLAFCEMFCRSLFVLLSFFIFGQCIILPSICVFWLPLWYLQTFVLHFWILTMCNKSQYIPIRGTASEVGGMVSATRRRKTIKDNKIVTPVRNKAFTCWIFICYTAKLNIDKPVNSCDIFCAK